MRNEQYTRTKGPTIFEEDSRWDEPKSLVRYRDRPSTSRREYSRDWVPYSEWVLLKAITELTRTPQHMVIDHQHSRKRSKWHTQIVIVTTLIVIPIVLRMIPLVLEFYLER